MDSDIWIIDLLAIVKVNLKDNFLRQYSKIHYTEKKISNDNFFSSGSAISPSRLKASAADEWLDHMKASGSLVLEKYFEELILDG